MQDFGRGDFHAGNNIKSQPRGDHVVEDGIQNLRL